MSHLGRWLSALVDGELDDAERDRILNHLARCSPCRTEANELRVLKRRITAMGDATSGSGSGAGIAGRLMDLTRHDYFRRHPGLAGSAGTWPVRRHPAAAYRSGGWRGQPGAVRAGAAMAVAVAAIGSAAFALGGEAHARAPKVTPAVEMFWQQHYYDTGQAPALPHGPGSHPGWHARPGGSP